MNVSPDALRKETVSTLLDIESVIDSVKLEVKDRNIMPTALRDHHGGWAMSPLLLAKATCLSTLVQLNEQGKK